jgi:hypothetical protein
MDGSGTLSLRFHVPRFPRLPTCQIGVTFMQSAYLTSYARCWLPMDVEYCLIACHLLWCMGSDKAFVEGLISKSAIRE